MNTQSLVFCLAAVCASVRVFSFPSNPSRISVRVEVCVKISLPHYLQVCARATDVDSSKRPSPDQTLLFGGLSVSVTEFIVFFNHRLGPSLELCSHQRRTSEKNRFFADLPTDFPVEPTVYGLRPPRTSASSWFQVSGVLVYAIFLRL